MKETTNILRILLTFKGVFSELRVDEEGVLCPMLVDSLPIYPTQDLRRMWTTKEGQDILTTMLSLDLELRHAEAGVTVPYGDVDAGKLVEDTRGMFDAIDQVLESERVALGLSCVDMMNRRREIDDVVKVQWPEPVSLGLLTVALTLIFDTAGSDYIHLS